jgi:uncharacterized protein (TIRG00374 family)
LLRNWRFWAGVVLSLLLLYVVFYKTNLGEVWAALQQANYLWLVPAVIVYLVGVGWRAFRWQYLLDPIKRIPARRLFPVVVIGYMANDVLPARLGEVVRAYILGEKEGVSKSATLMTIVVERVVDGLTLLLFILIASLFLPLDVTLSRVLRLATLLFVGVIVVLFLVASSRQLADRLVALVLRPLPEGPRGKIAGISSAFLDGLGVLRSGWAFAWAMLFSVLAWLCETAMYVFVAWGFGLQQPFTLFGLACGVGNLAAIVPSTPGYIGPFDAAVKYALVLFGVADGLATSYTLVLHAALLLPPILLGFYYLWREGLSLGEVSRSKFHV